MINNNEYKTIETSVNTLKLALENPHHKNLKDLYFEDIKPIIDTTSYQLEELKFAFTKCL